MTSDRYGAFTTPEQKEHIEVVESPVELARSLYLAWLPEARHIRYVELQQIIAGPEIPERLYASVVPRVRRDAAALGRMRPEELKGLEALLATLQQGPPDWTFDPAGILVSALLNETVIPSLDGVFQRGILGYRLAPGKTLVVRKGSNVRNLGMDGQGSILNYGDGKEIACGAVGGLQVNYGDLDGSVTHSVEGGVQANYGRCFNISHWARGGVQVNEGRTGEMATDLKGGVQVNYGTVKQMGAFAVGGIQYDAARGAFTGSSRLQNIIKMQVPMQRLLKRLEPVRTLKRYAKDPDGALAYIRGQDWGALERDVLQLGQDVRTAGKWS